MKLGYLFIIVLFSSCATIYDTAGIASKDYVDQKFVSVETEVKTLREEMDQVLSLIDEMEDNNAELAKLAEQLDNRIDNLTMETLIRLRNLINAEIEGSN